MPLRWRRSCGPGSRIPPLISIRSRQDCRARRSRSAGRVAADSALDPELIVDASYARRAFGRTEDDATPPPRRDAPGQYDGVALHIDGDAVGLACNVPLERLLDRLVQRAFGDRGSIDRDLVRHVTDTREIVDD